MTAINDTISQSTSPIKANWSRDKGLWQRTTEELYDEMLGCVPPLQRGNGAFMVGECYDADATDSIYMGFAKIGHSYYAKLCYLQSFKADCGELREYLERS